VRNEQELKGVKGVTRPHQGVRGGQARAALQAARAQQHHAAAAAALRHGKQRAVRGARQRGAAARAAAQRTQRRRRRQRNRIPALICATAAALALTSPRAQRVRHHQARRGADDGGIIAEESACVSAQSVHEPARARSVSTGNARAQRAARARAQQQRTAARAWPWRGAEWRRRQAAGHDTRSEKGDPKRCGSEKAERESARSRPSRTCATRQQGASVRHAAWRGAAAARSTRACVLHAERKMRKMRRCAKRASAPRHPLRRSLEVEGVHLGGGEQGIILKPLRHKTKGGVKKEGVKKGVRMCATTAPHARSAHAAQLERMHAAQVLVLTCRWWCPRGSGRRRAWPARRAGPA
jgi:hypothetical protein